MTAIHDFIDNEVKTNDVVLFMKGTPQFPQCGFSGQVVQILDYIGVDYKGINVEDDTKLRKQLREAGVEYAVIKNTLIRFAAKELGFDELDACLHGTTALAISTTDDVVAPAKILADFAKTHENFTLKAGYLEGKAIGEDEVKKLAAMPSKETLIAQVLYSFNYPIMQLAIACDAIVKKAEGNEEMKVAELVAPKEAAAEEAAE